MKRLSNSLLLVALSALALPGNLSAQNTKPSLFPPQITHVVVVFQENRTPDNLFHFLTPLCPIPKGATGLAACTPNPVTTSLL